MMDILKIIKEHHKAMIDKGFYDCLVCGGIGKVKDPNDDILWMPCTGECNSGINPDKNIGELLMLIVSELGEALEAHRNNRFANWIGFEILHEETGKFPTITFQNDIKDTFEDEIADVFLRLFDLCGYLVEDQNLDVVVNNYENSMRDLYEPVNFGEWMFRYVRYYLSEINEGHDKNYVPAGSIGRSLAALKRFSDDNNIPIEKHIIAKMAYNKTRPHKHGKEY